MAIDPALSEFAKQIESGQNWPRPECPKCSKGRIRFSSEPAESPDFMTSEQMEYLDPEWITGTFMVLGKCENPGCEQAVHATGDFKVGTADKSWHDDTQIYYSSYYEVRYFHPPLLIISAPEAAPEQVRKSILRASSVLFTAPALAATALRSTVEVFLATEGITAVRSNGSFRGAHERIIEWGQADASRSQIAELFTGIKWLGNYGTHEDSDLTTIQVLAGAKILDQAFDQIFEVPSVVAHAQALTAGKGSAPSS